MIDNPRDIYAFAFSGQLAEAALDGIGRKTRRSRSDVGSNYPELLGIELFDEGLVTSAEQMAYVYVAVATFENSVREMIVKTLSEEFQEDWWEQGVSATIKKQAAERQENEEKVKWHVQRGSDPINYTMLPNLINIIRNNYALFEPFIHDLEWASGVFDVVERSRNVIMHSGSLSRRDVARLGTFLRDWTSQVST